MLNQSFNTSTFLIQSLWNLLAFSSLWPTDQPSRSVYTQGFAMPLRCGNQSHNTVRAPSNVHQVESPRVNATRQISVGCMQLNSAISERGSLSLLFNTCDVLIHLNEAGLSGGVLCLCRVKQHTPRPIFTVAVVEGRSKMRNWNVPPMLSNMFLYTCCIVRPQCFGINYLCRGVYRLRFTVFIIVSMASFQAVLMRTTESLRVPGNIQEEMIQRTIICCNVIHCSMTGHNMTERNIYK